MSLVGMFATGEYEITRSKSGEYIKGRYVPGGKEKLKVVGSLQPSSAREMKLPEEGNRIHQVYKLYTDEKIVVNNTHTLADADHVTIDGESYRAIDVTKWVGTDLDYFVTAIWREPQQ